MEQMEQEFGPNLIKECMAKFKALQTVVLDNDGKVIPASEAMSKHKRVSLKDYTLDFRPKLQEQMYRYNETLEGRIKDLRDFMHESIEQVTQT